MTSSGESAVHGGVKLNVIETLRLTLREVSSEEITEILSGNRTEGRPWAPDYPFGGTIGGATLVARMVDGNTYRPGFGMYQVVHRESGLAIGDIGFHSAPDATGSVEIGYGLVEKFRGQGIATEITKSLLKWTLEQPEVSEVRAETDEDHLASRRVLEKTGFTFLGSDGETRFYAKRREPAVPDAGS
jgi:RimJ/RimL family protein N-acetyltransferase